MLFTHFCFLEWGRNETSKANVESIVNSLLAYINKFHSSLFDYKLANQNNIRIIFSQIISLANFLLSVFMYLNRFLMSLVGRATGLVMLENFLSFDFFLCHLIHQSLHFPCLVSLKKD